MKSTLSITFFVLASLLPFLVRDGRRYRVMLLSLVLLLPFYQGYIYFRYLILLYVIVITSFGNDRQMLSYAKEPINRSMMIFFVVSLVSALLSADLTLTSTPLWDLVFFYLFFLICLVSVRPHLTQSSLPSAFLLALLLSVFIQTMQLYGIEAFYIYDEDKLNMNTGMAYTNEDKVVRYWGPFGNALTFSSYLSVFGLFLFAYYHNSVQKRIRLLSYSVLVVTLYGVMLTAGRTALVSLFVGLFSYLFLKDWKQAIIVMACLAIIAFVLSEVIQNVLSNTAWGMVSRLFNLSNDKSYRTETWLKALPIFLNNPLFGTGPGNLQTQLAPLIHSIFINDKEALRLPWGHVENTYLSVLYTFGLTGFACFLYMLVKSFIYSWQTLKKSVPQPIKQLSYGLTTAWIVIGINMIANPVFVTDYRMISLMLLFVAMSIQIGGHQRKLVKQVELTKQTKQVESIYA